MKMKKLLQIIALVLVILTLAGGISAAAAAYSTYTYSINGMPLASPDAYAPDKVITSANIEGLDVPFNVPKDLLVDYNNRVYVADPTNNRIVILDRDMKRVLNVLTSFTNNNGVADALAAPEGVFVTKPKSKTEQGEIYVADTANRRIVVFNYDGTFNRMFLEPKSDVFTSDAIYSPISLAVDSSGRIYVVSKNTGEGIIALNSDGSFSCIVASQKVTVNVLDALWERFQTEAQKEMNEEVLSFPFGAVTIDDNDMLYAVVAKGTINPGDQQGAITGKSKSGDYAPVKKLNPDGDDIMRRNGFFPPSGEVRVKNDLTASDGANGKTGPSDIIDVALGDEGTWSIADQKRSHIFTYDKNGNLLYVFGDSGTQKGNVQQIASISYQFTDDESKEAGLTARLLVLDQSTNAITVYKRTEYGQILLTALEHTNNKEYDKAVDDWYGILQRNNNYDAAYVGIGDALYREGKWQEAMKMYKTAYDRSSYSNAFKMYRKDLVSKYIFLIVVAAVALIVLISKFFGFAGKINDKAAIKKGKRNIGEEILYAFHVMFHPFDGFWDLKHEKRGSVRGATFWLVLVIVAFVYQSFGTGYIASGNNGGSVAGSAISQAVGILVPLILFVTANWCLTTLFDGEGSFKDVYIATCYSAAPLSFLTIAATIVSNFVTESETGFVSLLTGAAWVWFFLLLFFGIMVTHDYSMSKNILTIAGTVVGMCIIMFLVILFSGLMMKMSSFIANIGTELSFRM
jgi:tetratricopeptide (TPR) repeat protein